MDFFDLQTSGDADAAGHDPDESDYFDKIIQDVAASLFVPLESSPGEILGRYRVIRSIGRGSMGSVYLAERIDGEIENTVAIKVLRADIHRAGWRERFLRERQLLASLQHPSIVHLMDAGHTDDGRPFLVMEHIDGVPIDVYASCIDIKERLKLFISVCEGVSYAHRQLIVHRDLKPSNILVDAGGRPKLLDFGIAKLLDETGEVTQIAEQLLTPDYASPEQLLGEAQSTATDVYSLGAVLYRLLTGATPRAKARETGSAEFIPPSRLNPQSPADLDFVMGKALRAEPVQRYGSVEEFAADIRAVLESRPVQARNGDRWYRARRALRRHWMPVVAAAMVAAGLSSGIWIANRERGIAERRFTDVRQLANKLLDIDTRVSQLPGASKTRQFIVDTALEYLGRVSADAPMEPDLALELGAAYMRVARVQGVNISPNLGQTAEAERTEQKAQQLIQLVLAAQPRNPVALLRAGQIAHDRMTLASDAGHAASILPFAHTAVERLNEYLQTGPIASLDKQNAQHAIVAFINVANQYTKSDRFDDAIATARRAIDIARATNWPAQEGAAMMVVAMSQRGKGELPEALLTIRESVRLLKPEEGERRPSRLHVYGSALIREGQILGEDDAVSLDRTGEAAARFEAALKMGEDSVRRDANDYQSQDRVLLAETQLAAILGHTEPRRSLELWDDALRRIAGASGHGSALRNETEALAASINPLLKLGRGAEARRRLDRALDRLRQLKQYPASQVELGSPADHVLRAQAEYETAGGNFTTGAVAYEKLLGLVLKANPTTERNLENAIELSNLFGAAIRVYRLAGRSSAADGIRQRRLDIWREWATKLPGNVFVARQLEAAQRL
jgi:tetratricopeptide (TPR) repeat protein